MWFEMNKGNRMYDFKHITIGHHRAKQSQDEPSELSGFIVALIVTVLLVMIFGW